MKKYPIDRFYVGKLNIGHRVGNLLLQSREVYRKDEIVSRAIGRGAIDIKNMSVEDLYNRDDRIEYDSLFSLFYRNDDDTYTCLHNGKIYSLNGFDYCSELVPLNSCLPNLSCKIGHELSMLEACVLFKNLFVRRETSVYNRDRYSILDYCWGHLELYCGTDTKDVNMAQRLMLLAKGINSYGGYTKLNNDCYTMYPVIALITPDRKLLNINDNRTYESSTYEDGSILRLGKPLLDDHFFMDRIDWMGVDIPQIQRLQRRSYNKRA